MNFLNFPRNFAFWDSIKLISYNLLNFSFPSTTSFTHTHTSIGILVHKNFLELSSEVVFSVQTELLKFVSVLELKTHFVLREEEREEGRESEKRFGKRGITIY